MEQEGKKQGIWGSRDPKELMGQETKLGSDQGLFKRLPVKLHLPVVPSNCNRFNTGNGEILPCVGCYQLPFWVTFLVVTWYMTY